MAVPLCLRCRWFPAAAPRPWSHWSHPASRSCKNAFDLRRVLAEHRRRIRRSRFALLGVAPAGRSLPPPAACSDARRMSPRLAGPARWPLRPSVGRLLGGSGRRVTEAVHLRPKRVAALRAAFPRGFAGRGRGRRPCGRRVPRTRTRRRVPAAARPAASRVARPYAARRGNEWRPERLERFPAAERARHLVAGVPEPIRPCHLRDREGGGVLLTARPLATCCYGVRPDGPRIIIKCQEARRIVEGLRTRAARRKSCCRS